jgi:hypothetical protein
MRRGLPRHLEPQSREKGVVRLVRVRDPKQADQRHGIRGLGAVRGAARHATDDQHTVVFASVVLISGVFDSAAYGRDPVMGVLTGAATSVAYAAFLLPMKDAPSRLATWTVMPVSLVNGS